MQLEHVGVHDGGDLVEQRIVRIDDERHACGDAADVFDERSGLSGGQMARARRIEDEADEVGATSTAA